MADARVIPMDGERTRGRRRSADSVLAGADRASGERARRRTRTTPLLAAREPVASEELRTPAEVPAKRATRKAAAKKSPVKKAAAEKTVATKAAPTKQVAKAATKKTAAKKTPAKKTPAKKAAAKTAATKKTVAEPTAKPAAERIPPAWAAAAQAESRSRATTRPAAVTWTSSAAAGDAPPVEGGRLSLAAGIAAQAGSMLLEALAPGRRRAEAEAAVAGALDFLNHRLSGAYEVDEFGFDPEFAEAVIGALQRTIYKRWFRVEVRGAENIPATGGALIVANHSGTLPVDAMMTGVAVHDATPTHRFLRALGADLVFQTPFLAGFARKAGVTLATTADAERLLAEGHVVGVWPEGFKGIGKPFTERYKLQRFGRGGFVSAALRTSTPIVPCSIVGAEEIFPIVGDVPALARLFGLPYVPITPFFPLLGPLGAIPLPSKWLIEFGPPIPTDEYGPAAADDPMLVFDITDRVRQTIQQTLYSLLVQRRSIFF